VEVSYVRTRVLGKSDKRFELLNQIDEKLELILHICVIISALKDIANSIESIDYAFAIVSHVHTSIQLVVDRHSPELNPVFL
jgi:hypothetical protein